MNGHNNCFSFIKLLAAFQVMFGHLVEHLALPCPSWIVTIVTYFRGVPIFFGISGFLIWLSIKRSTSYVGYLKKRFWRIYPELWVCVIIEVMTVVILYHDWSIKHVVVFAVTQGTIAQFWTPGSLRGYGCGTPNGTLWTICVMIQFYIIAWFVYRLFHKRKWLIWIVGFVVLVLASAGGELIVAKLGLEAIDKLYNQTIIRYCWIFFIGCFIAEFEDKIIPILSKFWYAFLIMGIVIYFVKFDVFAGYWCIWSVLLVSGLIGFAYRYPKLTVKPDISYGLFLYHMIIVNIFITMGWLGDWGYAIVVLLISLLCAYVSTVTIGRWSVRKKML